MLLYIGQKQKSPGLCNCVSWSSFLSKLSFFPDRVKQWIVFPRSKASDGNSYESDLMRGCSQEKGSEGSRIGQGRKIAQG